jgi:energy-converting hydrogenase Eha subunit C
MGVLRMENLLVMLGRLAGFAGVALCLVAGLARILGNFYLGGFSVISLLQAGMAGLLIGCFLLLLATQQRD